MALFAPDKDGVEFYARILEDAKNHLKPNGYVLFELGFTNGVSQSVIVSKIAENYGFTVQFMEKTYQEQTELSVFAFLRLL